LHWTLTVVALTLLVITVLLRFRSDAFQRIRSWLDVLPLSGLDSLARKISDPSLIVFDRVSLMILGAAAAVFLLRSGLKLHHSSSALGISTSQERSLKPGYSSASRNYSAWTNGAFSPPISFHRFTLSQHSRRQTSQLGAERRCFSGVARSIISASCLDFISGRFTFFPKISHSRFIGI